MKSGIGFVGTVFILAFIVVSCCAGTVRSRTDLSVQEVEGYYREKEQELVKEVRQFLDGEGFLCSGVMLNRVIEDDGTREYTLTVHHGKIDEMEDADRQLLLADLEKIAFQDDNCTFRHEFLINP